MCKVVAADSTTISPSNSEVQPAHNPAQSLWVLQIWPSQKGLEPSVEAQQGSFCIGWTAGSRAVSETGTVG